MRTAHRTLFGAVIVAVLIGAGCGTAGTENASGSASISTVQDLKKTVDGQQVKLMLSTGQRNLNDLVAYRAVDCAKQNYGLDVKLVIVADAGTTTVQAVLAHQVDMAEVSVGQIGDAVRQGADLKVFAPHDIQNDYIMVAKSSIGSPADMAGKVHGAAALTGQDPYNFNTIYQKAGVKSKVKTVLIGGSSDRVAALLSGRVDATMLHPYDAQTVIGKGGFHAIASAAEEVPPLVADVFFAEESWLNEHRAVALAWTSCVFVEAKWIYQDLDAAEQFAMSEVPDLDPQLTKETLHTLADIHFWGTEPLDLQDVQNTLDNEKAAKVQASDLVDGSIMQDALALTGNVRS